MEDYNAAKQVDWTLKAQLINVIAQQLAGATIYYSKQDKFSAFKAMKSIRMLIVPNLTTEEANEFKLMEKQLDNFYQSERKIFETYSSGFNKIPLDDPMFNFAAKEYLSNLNNATYEQYHEAVMVSLAKYGYLLGTKEDESIVGFD